MKNPNKQDFIFIAGVLLFTALTFVVYLFTVQYFIMDNCNPNIGLSEVSGYVGSGYTCFGYLRFFEENSIYFYFLFLWITIITYSRKVYISPSNVILISGVVLLLFVILYIVTPLIFLDDLPRIGR